MSKIAVIIPNYNHAPYLAQRIESVLGQTRADFDLLILDDCSPDGSRAVIAGYLGDPRVRTLFNVQNSGNTFAQWRKGLDNTQGDYVWIAESDDASEPDFLATLAATLDAHPQLGMAACESMVIDSTGAPQHRFLDQLSRPGHLGYEDTPFGAPFTMAGRDYCARYLVPWSTLPNASAILFRRSALLAAGGPVEDMPLCGDWMTYCRVLMHADFAWEPKPMNLFRTHGDNVRSRTKAADFVAQAMSVQRYVADTLGHDPTANIRLVSDQYSSALISSARPAGGGKVPLRSIPALLASAARFGGTIFWDTARLLARETAIGAARRAGLLRRPAR